MSATAASNAEREVVITRTVDAPREQVWKVWVQPEHVAQWWGPNGFTTTTYEMNVAPGGVWRFVMHGPDGVDYQNRIDFIEVVQPERLVYRHSGGEGEPGAFHVTVTFAQQGQKTHITLWSLFETAAERDFVVREHDAIEGGKQTLARLDNYLANLR